MVRANGANPALMKWWPTAAGDQSWDARLPAAAKRCRATARSTTIRRSIFSAGSTTSRGPANGPNAQIKNGADLLPRPAKPPSPPRFLRTAYEHVARRVESVARAAPARCALPRTSPQCCASLGHGQGLADHAGLQTALARASSIVDQLQSIDDDALQSFDGIARVMKIASDVFTAAKAIDKAVTGPLAPVVQDLGQQLVMRVVTLYLRARWHAAAPVPRRC